jgi:hypothetical protein
LITCVAFFGVTVSQAWAVAWFDDFNDGNAEDGNPVTWTYNEIGFTPGTYDATSGDYFLAAPGNGNNNSLVASVDVPFQNTYVRTQTFVQPGMAPEEVGGNVGVVARLDPLTLTGYAAILDDNDQYELLRIDGGQPVTLMRQDGLDIGALSDALIELNIVGDQLSLFLWRPGEPKPAEPIVTVTDGNYPSGRAGILFNEDDDNTAGIFRFAAAQDTPFVDMLAGDFNMDGSVDAADYAFWRDRLGNPFTPNDYNVWRTNFGKTAGGGAALPSANPRSAAVPEPAACLILLAGIVSSIFLRRRIR